MDTRRPGTTCPRPALHIGTVSLQLRKPRLGKRRAASWVELQDHTEDVVRQVDDTVR